MDRRELVCFPIYLDSLAHALQATNYLMKCESIACIWSDSPPVHRITASAVVNQPPTLYTGGSDGAIVSWNLNHSNHDIKPIAMLCGHAAPIAGLGICLPAAISGNEKIGDSSNVVPNSYSVNYGELISACTDGVLCVWSRGSGHCRRRRRMPPWVGSPSMVQPLPDNPRYVCVACDSGHLFDHQSLDSTEGGESLVNKELEHRKPSKCTVVIVDSYSLTIVQTVLHRTLSSGPLRFMSVILPVGDMEKQSVLMVDSFGKVQYVPIFKDSDPSGINWTGVQKVPSQLEMTDWVDMSNEGALLVAFAIHGQVLALVYKTYCIFKLVEGGTTIGEISFLHDHLCLEDSACQSQVVGGMFLESDDARMTLDIEKSPDIFAETFVVWNNRGSALIYSVSYSGNIFKSEPPCAIPAVYHRPDVRLSISFIQLNRYLLRTESICFPSEKPLPWKPRITIWLLPQLLDNSGKYNRECKMVGRGNFFDNWNMNTFPIKTECPRQDGVKLAGEENELTCQQKFASCRKNADDTCANDERYSPFQNSRLVSSSMVISENHFTPYAIVYGFYSGDIEVLRFHMFFEGLDSPGESPRHEADSCTFKQYLSGHTGAVLCLASHRTVNTLKDCGFNRILVSGSMDCTIRIWDLDSCNLISVMHQHVAPIRQIILPPPQTDRPWSGCFLSIGEDSCVSLASLETMRVERMFPGHPFYPAKVVWDSTRGYVACLCLNHSRTSDSFDALYIWDIKTGARERVLRGTAAHSMFDHFCVGINTNPPSASMVNENTSASSLLFPIVEDSHFPQSQIKNLGKGVTPSNISSISRTMTESNTSQANASKRHAAKLFPFTYHPIKCSCPFPGIGILSFDLASLISLCQKREFYEDGSDTRAKAHVEEQEAVTPKNGYKRVNSPLRGQGAETPSPHHTTIDIGSDLQGTLADPLENNDWVRSLEGRLLQFSLSFLHSWNVDCELDRLLIADMKLKKPDNFTVASGLLGDRGSLTLTFPGTSNTLELWKWSSEFCAMRSLTMVSLAQHMVILSHSCSAASSALAAFYTRNFAEKISDIKPPLLQLLVSFWQDESDHVRMAARSLFHCAASRAIPFPLRNEKANDHAELLNSSYEIVQSELKNSSTGETFQSSLESERQPEAQGVSHDEGSEILSWLESFEEFEEQDWISSVGGTSQDAMNSHIIVAAALAVWYPSLVKPNLAMLAVHPLMKLVMAMNGKYSSTAAEILAEGMEGTWKACISSEIPRLIGDIFFQIECVSGASAQNPSPSLDIRETLIGILLPSLAMADISGFLNVIERQIWSTASDSPVHIVSLMTLIRVVRGSPRNLAQYLDKVINFILQTMDPGNSVMRKTCLQSSMAALKEVVRIYPMVALNDTSTRLAVGDALGEIKSASIGVYDMQSMMKIKVLDASGPPGLPNLLGGASEVAVATAISALSFSPDGEGLVAFSEHGLMIRWWSLESAWWEKISRNLVPVQCTKLIFVPPWEGFSPNSTRSSIMASVLSNERQTNLQENTRVLSEMDRVKHLIHNLDLSYRLQWVGRRKVKLTLHGHELGTYQL